MASFEATESSCWSASSAAVGTSTRKKPVAVVVIGMAGSGKTTLMHRINLHMVENNINGYYINLDPAVNETPFGANIDIRDTINYKEVMKQYGLGPNGGILTSLNLFATRFDQVMNLLDRRADQLDYIFIDTPGQIEILPDPMPLVCAFNKIDVVPCEFAVEWMSDFESFQNSLDSERNEEYMGSFNRSLSLMLDEFYNSIRTVGVSAMTGAGIERLFAEFIEAAAEFETTYVPNPHKDTSGAVETDSMKRDMEKLKMDIDEDKRANLDVGDDDENS